jgi:hypothetical protein
VLYYADRGDTPGRWLGQGARELELAGEVNFDDFTKVLAGRDPRTGGPPDHGPGLGGRVASLGTGTVARLGPNGEALYSVRDAARILGWSQTDVRTAVAEGERLAASRLLGAVTGTVNPAGTRTAGTTGNERGSDSGRDRNAGTRTPEPGRAPATDPATGTAPTTPGRTSADSADARHGKDRERTGQRSRPGLGRGYPRNGIGTEPNADRDGDREPS